MWLLFLLGLFGIKPKGLVPLKFWSCFHYLLQSGQSQKIIQQPLSQPGCENQVGWIVSMGCGECSPTWVKIWSESDPGRSCLNRDREVTWAGHNGFKAIWKPFRMTDLRASWRWRHGKQSERLRRPSWKSREDDDVGHFEKVEMTSRATASVNFKEWRRRRSRPHWNSIKDDGVGHLEKLTSRKTTRAATSASPLEKVEKTTTSAILKKSRTGLSTEEQSFLIKYLPSISRATLKDTKLIKTHYFFIISSKN